MIHDCLPTFSKSFILRKFKDYGTRPWSESYSGALITERQSRVAHRSLCAVVNYVSWLECNSGWTGIETEKDTLKSIHSTYPLCWKS